MLINIIIRLVHNVTNLESHEKFLWFYSAVENYTYLDLSVVNWDFSWLKIVLTHNTWIRCMNAPWKICSKKLWLISNSVPLWWYWFKSLLITCSFGFRLYVTVWYNLILLIETFWFLGRHSFEYKLDDLIIKNGSFEFEFD